jgi:predicted dehydrogenase
MPERIRWAVLGAARIAIKKVIPAMQRGAWSTVVGIASRDLANAQSAAEQLGLSKAYGCYEEALADPEVDAIYNPLPNHLHVPWSIRAAEAGKHVLCEKPIGLNVAECRQLIEVRDRTNVRISEAFMVRVHPQWLRTRELVRSGEIGDLRVVMGAFTYFNRDAGNIRNNAAYGGGALMDIGCYPIQISRFLFEQEPNEVHASMEQDPQFGVDRLSSALLRFPKGHAIFTCSTQVSPYQRIQVLGTKGRIEVEIPFNAPPDRHTRILVTTDQERIEEFPVCDQYTLQGDAFSRAVRLGTEVPTPLEDSLLNMTVIERLTAASRSAGS